jgi:hypothetical protein
LNKFIIILLFVCLNLQAKLNKEQISKIIISYNIGKKIIATDGMDFGYTLLSIMGVETYYGVCYIGDKYDENGKLKSLYLSSLGNFQIKLSTARIVICKEKSLKKYKYLVNPYGNKVYSLYRNAKQKYLDIRNIHHYSEYKKYKLKKYLEKNVNYKKYIYFKKIYNSKKWNALAKNNNIKAIKTLKWAKRNMEFYYKKSNKQIEKYSEKFTINSYYKFIKYKRELRKKIKLYKENMKRDTLLINKLIGDFEFSATIAGYYLKYLYEQAKIKKLTNPYRRSIGRYNGGWNNKRYYLKVIKKLKFVKKIIKKNLK